MTFKTFQNVLTREDFITCNSFVNTGWQFIGVTDNVTTKEQNNIWANDTLSSNSFFTEYFLDKIKHITGDNLVLERVYANGQTFGLPGGLHMDSDKENAKTFLFYAHGSWRPEWGGATMLLDKTNTYQYFPPIPNSAVYFNGNQLHVGLEPTRMCKDLRISIAFKLLKI